MMSWPHLEWAHPWWSLLALQPFLMALLLKLRHRQVLHYADAHLLAWVVRGRVPETRGRWRGLVNVAAWLLLACAAAGPRLPLISDSAQPAQQRHAMDIMVLLDVSPSMLAQDVAPQRLQRAKLELLDLVPRLHGERLGLLAFSGTAAVIMPLSRDYAALNDYLGMADPGLFDQPGTALASALELAQRNLNQQKSASRAILLLTDADTNALSGAAGAAIWEAANKLNDAGTPLYILGVGTTQGASIPQANGYPLVHEGVEVISSLDQSGFSSLARIANGKFSMVEDGDGDWRALYDHGILTLPGGKQAADSVQAWQELYGNFLLPALLLFISLHLPLRWSRAAPLSAALLATWLMAANMQPVFASELEAHVAYVARDYARAQALYGDVSGYAGRMGEGAAAYRRKDYQYAIKQFGNALLSAHDNVQRERALFNLGNSYFMANGYRAAAESYLGVLRYTRDNQAARANLAMAAGKLAEQAGAGRKVQGIAGRRGRETGGALGEEVGDNPLSMEGTDEKKRSRLGRGSELDAAEQARLLGAEMAGLPGGAAQIDHDMAYRAALKKLELKTDDPLPLHKALIKIEAAREYVPLQEMSPW